MGFFVRNGSQLEFQNIQTRCLAENVSSYPLPKEPQLFSKLYFTRGLILAVCQM